MDRPAQDLSIAVTAPSDPARPARRTTWRLLTSKLLLCILGLVCIQARGDEASVRALMQSKFQDAKIASVTKSGYGGLYEVYLDGQLGYTDEQLSFLIIGNLIDTKTNQNVSQQRLRKLTAVNIREIPLDLGIVRVRGNGKRQLVVFSDPMCPYCLKLEQELARMNNVTIYTMLYPIEQKFKGTTDLARQIWCASDRTKAWEDWMMKRIRPTAKPTCNDPLSRIEQIGSKLGIDTTPTVIFADGGIIPGAMPVVQLEKLLNETPAR